MKLKSLFWVGLAVAGWGSGCESIPAGVERGPHRTIAYDVLIEASEPGARIEAGGSALGNTPLHLKIFGDTDGTFHDFGSYEYVIRAFPLATNQFSPIRVFHTGRGFTPEDLIPRSIYFDMNQKATEIAPLAEPLYYYPPPPFGPPVYYYGAPYYYYGPAMRFHYDPPFHRRRR